MEADTATEFVEVLDLTFMLAVPGENGEPAKLRYTVRDHLGDVVTDQPGGISIQFAVRELANGKRLAGKKVSLATAMLIGMERDIRLEKRTRQSIANIVDPQKELREKLHGAGGVSDPHTPSSIILATS